LLIGDYSPEVIEQAPRPEFKIVVSTGVLFLLDREQLARLSAYFWIIIRRFLS
jgi:hypothetical protein